MQAPDLDTVLLACTHYPLLEKKIRKHLPKDVKVISQGKIVAASLKEYLGRHRKLEAKISQGGHMRFCTTDNAGDFEQHGALFFGEAVTARQVHL